MTKLKGSVQKLKHTYDKNLRDQIKSSVSDKKIKVHIKRQVRHLTDSIACHTLPYHITNLFFSPKHTLEIPYPILANHRKLNMTVYRDDVTRLPQG